MVHIIYFFYGRDRQSNRIVEDGASGLSDFETFFRTSRHWEFERSARSICSSHNIDFMDWDGPYSWALWRKGLRTPKWENQRPPQIARELWENRLKSIDELKAFRAGLAEKTIPRE